jgi:hypothetical protein
MSAGHSIHCDPDADVCYRTLDFLGLPGYRVGEDGSVWTAWKRGGVPGKGKCRLSDQWNLMKLTPQHAGHLQVCLGPNRGSFMAHRLVLLAFVGPCPAGLEACHNDGNPANNRLANLRWDTRKSNAADKVRHGRSVTGEKCPHHKLTERDIPLIFELRSEGMSQQAIGERLGVVQSVISAVLRGESWKHVRLATA